MFSFPNLEPVLSFMFSSNYCFLTCIQICQEADKMVWYSHLFQKFPQFVVILTVKGFGIVNKAKIDIFLEFLCFFYDPTNVGNLISGSSAFSKSREGNDKPLQYSCLENPMNSMKRAMLSKPSFLLMGGAVFSPCSLT